MDYEPDSALPAVFIIDDDETDRLLAQRALRRIRVPNPVREFSFGTEFMEHVQAATRDAGPDGRAPAGTPPRLRFDLHRRGPGVSVAMLVGVSSAEG